MTTTKVKSVCPYCGVGCGIVLEVSGNRVLKVTGDKEHPTNFGRLCTKGSTCAQAIAESGRMEFAYKRLSRKKEPIAIGMADAISTTARELRAILDKHGPDALSFYVSGQMSLEAQYLINKLAKGYVRTNNIESNSRLCMASAGSGYKLSLGADGPPGSYQDMDSTDLFFVIGANMADCHPILYLRMMDRVKQGAKLIVVDPRRHTGAEKADLFMQIKPGTDLALLNGILHLLVKNGHTDSAFIEEFTSGWESMPSFLENYPPDQVAEITGIPEADIRQAASWIGESPEWMTCWTMGLNQSTHGTWHTNAICNLHLATGKICRTGSGPFSLTGQPNAMGGREMGYMGPGLPGQRSVLVQADRDFMEDMWSIPRGTLKTEAGSGTVSMFESMMAGDIKACWIICTNPVATVPNRKNVIAGLEAAELVIAQDAFFETETNRYADILLPGALWAEGEGVMINSERNLTLMEKAVEPPGESLPDWQIIARVACEMGYAAGFTYASSAEVYQEIQRAWNPKTGYDIRGASYERLRETPVQWPAAPGSGNDRNPIRYLNDGISQQRKELPDGSHPRIVFATENGKGVFLARPYVPPAEMPDADFPFVLNTGRLQHQWHTMTKTGKIAKLNKLNPGPFIEIHPEDAEALGIKDQDRIEISSRRGLAILPAVVTDRVRPGNCFAPFHWNDVFGEKLAVNEVTSDAVDSISFQPELKFCAVSLTKQKEEVKMATMAPVDTLAAMLGVQSSPMMTLDSHEKLYLSGFLTSLRADESRPVPGIPVLPPTAPLEPSKRYWLDGLLAGMFSRTYLPEAAAEPVQVLVQMPAQVPVEIPQEVKAAPSTSSEQMAVTILWASQTGNAEGAAIQCAQKLQEAGYNVRLLNMKDCAPADLISERYVLFLVSTFGAGDPPDNGASFWQSLQGESMPRMSELRYAVLAFGDSNYDLFCGFGRKLDERLEQLGAKRLNGRVDCDTDYEEQSAAWMNAVVKKLREPIPMENHTTYDRNHPLAARLVKNRLLNGEGSEKETRHYVFDLTASGLRYEAGDALGVWPVNDPKIVSDILETVKLDPFTQVALKDKGQMTIAEALQRHCEISRVTPGLLAFVQERAESAMLGNLIKNKPDLKKWLWGRQLVDVLQAFPLCVSVTAEELLQVLKPLQPRLYSISSSPLANPGEVHITVSTVRYETEGKPRTGVCSGFLADRVHGLDEVRLFIQKSQHFRPPANPDAGMIMIGPGTGIGPFRGFLQERQAMGAKGKNWLIFGEQRAACDFYFKEELETMLQEGGLHRLDTAFSRDQAEKIYVQHRMLEHGAELWGWLKDGAHFYICGDAGTMAKEVDATLKQIIQQHSGMSASETESYVKEMSRTKRYAKDVY
ncbi:bifunctional nitrate reductase/sulfite reductase flavoprotein subunit alpha [Paenibacillus planticolens]|uniref:Molybdopterin-dependent oxidoreductase n=1 Tax=Paenibacillus planticolens TaxID=2654976 RepID=A0ABX1ZJP8_9BACL|nr:bifunctional nitrate reductase/sulfite reductase flavoprotein subunit alpha [Paenibacillus planticolens]NOV00312.1 molybdopterin-dependent oxidoreductase [Paenibacillus planticolens]